MPWPRETGALRRMDLWTRKLHIYAGLLLLSFTWLFALSGLVLNHSQWKVARFWPERKQVHFERRVQLSSSASQDQQAQSVMRQLGIFGEVAWPAGKQKPGRLGFQITRPGRIATVSIDTGTGAATVDTISVNAWGILNMLHSFTGVRGSDGVNARDWALTRAWSFCMDAVCVGLIFMALSGCWIWARSYSSRPAGISSPVKLGRP